MKSPKGRRLIYAGMGKLRQALDSSLASSRISAIHALIFSQELVARTISRDIGPILEAAEEARIELSAADDAVLSAGSDVHAILEIGARVCSAFIASHDAVKATQLASFLLTVRLEDRLALRCAAQAALHKGDAGKMLAYLRRAYPRLSESDVLAKEMAREQMFFEFRRWAGAPDVWLLSSSLEDRFIALRGALAQRLLSDPPLGEVAVNRLQQLIESCPAFPREEEAGESSLLQKEAEELYRDAHYEEAEAILHRLLTEPRGLHTAPVELAAAILRARSRYAHARSVLLLRRHGPPRVRARIWADLSTLAWIEHDYAKAGAFAHQALAIRPDHQRARNLLERALHPITPETVLGASEQKVLSHAAFYVGKGDNFGDASLPVAVRQSFQVRQAYRWLPIHVHQCFDEERLRRVNQTNGLVIGGGGLFLPDTSPNGVSGWQWNVSCEALRKIDVPLVTFAVGYNLFHGQSFKGNLFESSLRLLAEKATFLGLRNYGSVGKVRELLGGNLQDRVEFVPCPTTVLAHIEPEYATFERNARSGLVLLNAAFDRSERRFVDQYETFLREIASFIAEVRKSGAEVACVCHVAKDEKLAIDLREQFGIELEVHRLQEMDLLDCYRFYCRASLVIGMRGHATMIPFGLRTPVLSLISHPKLRYFLEDIQRPEWGVDVLEPHFADHLIELTRLALDNEDARREEIAQLQIPLLDAVTSASQRFLRALS